MEKEFVTYKQALALKKLGFDEPCLSSFDENKNLFKVWENDMVNGKTICLAPLYQQAFRWFRDKYDIITQIIYCTEEYDHTPPEEVGYHGIILLLKNKEEEEYLDHWYKTYEETEDACLDKLIEICKNK